MIKKFQINFVHNSNLITLTAIKRSDDWQVYDLAAPGKWESCGLTVEEAISNWIRIHTGP